MRHHHISSERADETPESVFSESHREGQSPRSVHKSTRSVHKGDRPYDERRLYGEPCHEDESGCDEKQLYGEPQHEIREENEEIPDIELLFARLRAESTTDPVVLSSRSESKLESTGR